MPRMLVPPYTNDKHLTNTDIVRRRRAHRANAAVIRAKYNSTTPMNLSQAGAMIATSPRADDVKFQTANKFSTPVTRRAPRLEAQGSGEMSGMELRTDRSSETFDTGVRQSQPSPLNKDNTRNGAQHY